MPWRGKRRTLRRVEIIMPTARSSIDEVRYHLHGFFRDFFEVKIDVVHISLNAYPERFAFGPKLDTLETMTKQNRGGLIPPGIVRRWNPKLEEVFRDADQFGVAVAGGVERGGDENIVGPPDWPLSSPDGLF